MKFKVMVIIKGFEFDGFEELFLVIDVKTLYLLNLEGGVKGTRVVGGDSFFHGLLDGFESHVTFEKLSTFHYYFLVLEFDLEVFPNLVHQRVYRGQACVMIGVA
jgi:hypothetical protein